ncbi:hypothetical protein ACOMHN_058586 [Nucella lapillus]
MVTKQLEYYFSEQNLVRALNLRKNMDSDGWVVIAVISPFRRMLNLVSDKPEFNLHRQTIALAAQKSEHQKNGLDGVLGGFTKYLNPTTSQTPRNISPLPDPRKHQPTARSPETSAHCPVTSVMRLRHGTFAYVTTAQHLQF